MQIRQEGGMLDDKNVVQQRDPSGALTVAANEYAQANLNAKRLL